MLLSIIIPQYNMPSMTEKCIQSILDHTKVDYEIVLVDNGSKNTISEDFKNKVVYIRSDENLLFSGGCNLGASKSSGDYLCFLNNDTIVRDGWDSCVEFIMSRPDVGIVGPKLLYADNTIQHAGVRCIGNNINGGIFDHIYRGLPENDFRVSSIREYQCVTGACMFIRKNDFLSVGGFSTEFRNGYEDNDLCFKIRFDLGKKVYYYPESSFYHLENKTPRDASTHFNNENHIAFFKKWGDKLFVDVRIIEDMDKSEAKTSRRIESYWRLLS